MKLNRKVLLALALVAVVIGCAVGLTMCGTVGHPEFVTVTVENGMGGGIYDYGAEVTVTAIVPNGQFFSHWTVDGKEISTENPYTFQAKKDMTITANLTDTQPGGSTGTETPFDGDWADAVYDENLEVTINWWRLQPIYFVGDTLKVSEYPVETFTDERANEVDDYKTLLRIAKAGGAEEIVDNAEGYTFSEAGEYVLYRYAMKDGKYAKSQGFAIKVLAPDGTAPEGVELHNAAVVGGQYVLKRSTVGGSMGNILEGTADFSYVAFTKADGYGPGMAVTVTFTGKNRPSVGMLLKADPTLLGGKTGFIAGDFATYDPSGSQTYLRRLTVFDYESIGNTGDIISNPIRPATFSGGLDGVNDVPCAWNMLDDNKTYEYTVGTWTEAIKGSNKERLVLSVQLHELDDNGGKTLIYSQNRDITEGGQYAYAAQSGDIVLYGSNKKEIAFTATVAEMADKPAGDVAAEEETDANDGGGMGQIGKVVTMDGMELYNATVKGERYTLKRSMVGGSMGDIRKGTANFSYLAFTQKGGYGPGTWVAVTFTGKNRPNVGMFFDAKRTLLGGKTGFIVGDFASTGNQTYLRRLTVFDYANINKTGDLISNPLRPANFTGANGVNDLPPAWKSLDSNKTYEYLVGSRTEPVAGTEKSKLILCVRLFERQEDGSRILVYTQDRDITDNGKYAYASQSGDIVLLGSNMKNITFSAKLLTAEEVEKEYVPDDPCNSDDFTELEGRKLYNGQLSGSSYTLKRSDVSGSMANILAGGADFSYLAFTQEGGYGPGTGVTVTFTGKNRPNIGMFFEARSTLLGGKSGFILGDFASPSGNQTYLDRLTVFDYANINKTGDIINNPLRPATFTGTEGVNGVPSAWNMLDEGKTYEYTAATRKETVAGKNLLHLSVELYEVGTDGAKTLLYSQERDITNGGQYDYASQSGDIVLLGSNMSDITFSATVFTKEQPDEGGEGGEGSGDSGDTDEGGVTVLDGRELYKAKLEGSSYTLKRSDVSGSMGNILDGTADFSYLAFTKEGGYGPGNGLAITFTGKNRPNVGMFFDADATLLSGQSGFILGDFASATSQTYLRRLTVFDYASIAATGDLISNPVRPATFTGSTGVNDLPCAWNSLEAGKNYEYIVVAWDEIVEGTNKSKLTLVVQLYEVAGDGTKTLIYSQDRDITNGGQYAYASQSGDIVLLGSNMNDITFSARLLTEAEVDDIRYPDRTVRVTNGTVDGQASVTVKHGQTVTVTANEPGEGQRFAKWVDGTGTQVSTEASYTFAVTGDISLTAIYADIQKYTVTVVGGTVDGLGDKEIYAGTAVTVVANTPGADREFVGWKIGETTVSTENSYTFTPEGDVTVTAVFQDKAPVETPATNKATQNADGSWTVQASGLTAGNRDNIYGAGANLDWGYTAFKGDYGPGTMVSVTFKGKNRPSIGFGHDATNTFNATTGFILGGSTSGGHNGTKGRLQIFNMNNIHTTGKLISTPNRIAYTGTPLDSAVTATTSTDSIAPAFNYLDDNKTYEYVVGTWTEEGSNGAKKFMVNVILFEVAEDGTKTCIYQQSRDANDNGRWAYEETPGDVVLYGTFDATVTFSARLVKDSAEIAKYNAARKGNVWEAPKQETPATNKATQNADGSWTIQKSGLSASYRNDIDNAAANLDWGYTAFKGDYGVGSAVSVTFTGKNRPSIGFGHDATNKFDATTGFIIGGSVSGDEKNRLSMAVMNNIATGQNLLSITDRVVFSSNDSSGTMPSINNLDDSKTYEYTIVTWQEKNAAKNCNKFMVGVVLMEIAGDGTKTCVYQQSRDINIDGKYNLDSHTGDIVLYGAFDLNLTFSARVVKDTDEIAKYRNVRKGNVWEP